MGQRNSRDEPPGLPFRTGAGNIQIGSNCTTANGSANVTISNVAPAGVGTATITKWLTIVQDGVTYYIPMWT